jgi:hypothetical protein
MCVCVDSETQIQATKSGSAKPNSEHGKSVKASINSPIYRREGCSQSTENIGTRWANSHQHQQHASTQVCLHLVEQCKRIITQVCNNVYTCLTIFSYSLAG